jgi:hypothetical protein
MAIGISVTIFPETQEEAVKVVEALSRVATGLAFEGLSVSISIHTYDLDLEET